MSPVRHSRSSRQPNLRACQTTGFLAERRQQHQRFANGRRFEQLRLLRDNHAGEQLELINTLAERVQMLGGVAIVDRRRVAELTRLERAPNRVEEVPAMLARLLSTHEAIITAGACVPTTLSERR